MDEPPLLQPLYGNTINDFVVVRNQDISLQK